jgi:hypothetical protein
MSDTIEDYAAMRRHCQEENAKRRVQGEAVLKAAGVSYTAYNNGQHIVIEAGGGVFDYWPSTGRWRMRPRKGQFGVDKLLAAIAQRRLVSQDFSKLEQRAIAHGMAYTHGPEAFIERMTRAYPHLKGDPA